VRGFPLSVAAVFRLRARSPSLAVIFAALSPHPEIPFLADKVGAAGMRRFRRSERVTTQGTVFRSELCQPWVVHADNRGAVTRRRMCVASLIEVPPSRMVTLNVADCWLKLLAFHSF
jgi:hypothetical protein